MKSAFFEGPVVCNTGPLLGLARADLVDLLAAVFPAVLVPEAVARELLAKDTADREQVDRVLAAVQVLPLAAAVDPLLVTELDAGEAAVIQLAREQHIDRVLIDEKKARRVAAIVYGLEVKGTAALLIEAKKRSLLASVADALAAMSAGGYFHRTSTARGISAAGRGNRGRKEDKLGKNLHCSSSGSSHSACPFDCETIFGLVEFSFPAPSAIPEIRALNSASVSVLTPSDCALASLLPASAPTSR